MTATTLEQRIGLPFIDGGLLQQALTHPSFLNEHPELIPLSNQRLEFLGDAVLGMSIAQELFERFPQLPEGDLTKLRSYLVNGSTLAKAARRLGVGEHLRLGRGEETTGGGDRESNLAAVLEAIVGAVFLERGYQQARELSLALLDEEISDILKREVPQDPKSQLQELLQGRGESPPVYRIKAMDGPDHHRLFTVEVLGGSTVMGTGQGGRKLEAEQESAREALRLLGTLVSESNT